MDVLAVEAATRKALDYVRSGAGPYFLECRTYRFRAHSMFDAELYRAKNEVEEWKTARSDRNVVRPVEGRGFADDADLSDLRANVAAEVDRRGELRRGRHVGTGRGSDALCLFGNGAAS